MAREMTFGTNGQAPRVRNLQYHGPRKSMWVSANSLFYSCRQPYDPHGVLRGDKRDGIKDAAPIAFRPSGAKIRGTLDKNEAVPGQPPPPPAHRTTQQFSIISNPVSICAERPLPPVRAAVFNASPHSGEDHHCLEKMRLYWKVRRDLRTENTRR